MEENLCILIQISGMSVAQGLIGKKSAPYQVMAEQVVNYYLRDFQCIQYAYIHHQSSAN